MILLAGVEKDKQRLSHRQWCQCTEDRSRWIQFIYPGGDWRFQTRLIKFMIEIIPTTSSPFSSLLDDGYENRAIGAKTSLASHPIKAHQRIKGTAKAEDTISSPAKVAHDSRDFSTKRVVKAPRPIVSSPCLSLGGR